jgi:hypothetical protein
MDLNKEIQSLEKANGIFYCVVADLFGANEFIILQGGSEMGSYPYSIIASYLQEKGYRVLPLTSSERADDESLWHVPLSILPRAK